MEDRPGIPDTRTVRARLRLPALLFLLASPACKNTEQQQQIEDDARKLTVDSTTDATAPLVDDNCRFRLGWPGEGWKLVGPTEAAALWRDAQAGAIGPGQLGAAVMVQGAPGASLDAYAELVLSNAQLRIAELHVESREPVTFAGEPAVRVSWTGALQGLTRRWITTVFVHDGHGYQVIGWGPSESFDVQQLAPVLGQFSLLEGKVSGPPLVTLPDRDGAGWRLAGGVFESVVSGIRIAPPTGWRVGDPAALAAAGTGAEVGLEAPSVGAHVLLTPQRVDRRAAAAFRSSRLAEAERTLGAKRSGTWTAMMFGVETEFAVFEDSPLEYLVATHVLGDFGIETVVTAPVAGRDVARPSIATALASVTELDVDARAVLRAALESGRDPQRHVGATHALRGGVLRDFDAAIRWTKPAGFWTLRAADDLSTPEEEKLQFSSLDTGLAGRLVTEPRAGGDAAAYHEERVRALGGTSGPKRTVPIANGTADVTTVIHQDGDLRFRTELATVLHRDWAVMLQVSGEAGQVEAAADEVAAIFAGLELTQGFPMTREVNREYIDARLGFAITMPLFDWTYTDRTPPERAAFSAGIVFENGGAKLTLTAIVVGDGVDPDVVRGLAEQAMRSALTKRMGAATEGTATLGGAPARRTTWAAQGKRAEMISAAIGAEVFVLVAEDVEAKDLERFVSSFRLLE